MDIRVALDSMQGKLTQAAELVVLGSMSQQLYEAALAGILAALPKPLAPKHIHVLKRITEWKEAELLPQLEHQQLSAAVLAASKSCPTASASTSGTATSEVAEGDEAPAVTQPGVPAAVNKGKKRVPPPNSRTLFDMMPGASKTMTLASELRQQRELALKNVTYEPQTMDMNTFTSEHKEADAAAPSGGTKKFCCSKCPKSYNARVGLQNHVKWHALQTQEKVFANPEAKAMPKPHVDFELEVDAKTLHISCTFSINGKVLEEIAAEAAAEMAEQTKQQNVRRKEKRKREALREAGDCAEQGDHRRGSKIRRSYTARNKLKLLELFDTIMDDESVLKKIEAFEGHAGGKGTPYTTALKWSKPAERARISTAAGEERASTLLRIDKSPRKKGSYGPMEKVVFDRLKERRANGRKVSPRWLSATARLVMKEMYPDENFKGGRDWRRRFARRFKIAVRCKTNVKNKTWSATEEVLLRYFTGLRRRVRGDYLDTEEPEADEAAVEPEPDDTNPPREEDSSDEEAAADEPALDSSDEEDSDDELTPLQAVMPEGFEVAGIPTPEQLAFRSEYSESLVGLDVATNWAGVGWIAGTITMANHDGRKKINGVAANFIVHYSDETDGTHAFAQDMYGPGDETGRWVLFLKKL